MNPEQSRATKPEWKTWGPYITDRQWGTVREDYSSNGNAWEYLSHDAARSKAFRWGEEGIAGICDNEQLLCFALALWNKNDPILKERYFGLTGNQGNHGEDVKELYYYLDNTPSHSYMKMLYKYPQQAYPYDLLLQENNRRTKADAEYELIDTGIFEEDAYFDVFVEYAKADETDLLIKITVANRGKSAASLHILPTIWFRNTWSWGYDDTIPRLMSSNDGELIILHKKLGNYTLHLDQKTQILFCDNETNNHKLYHAGNTGDYCKDGINDYLVSGNENAVNINALGTKAALNYEREIPAESETCIRLRLSAGDKADNAFSDFDTIFAQRIVEADAFYRQLQEGITDQEEKDIQRQAFAGMLWSKQFYYYNVQEWLDGDPAEPKPADSRRKGRNHDWRHVNNSNILSMPDKWEYPWYAAWDLAFHCIPFALIDAGFAKKQLQLLTREWFMHPNGQLPAYEWSLGDVNPPVHAWATWRVYTIDQRNNEGKGDISFLESVFHKLLLNFTWWVNRKDKQGNNIFEGGFLGLDNIGVFDRNATLPSGEYIEQADGTSWMAMYALNMLRISLELAKHNKVYQDMATKFFEHFLYIAGAIDNMGQDGTGLWDEDDQFYYDVLKLPNDGSIKLKVRSLVGLIPLFAVEVLDHAILDELPEFAKRLNWFLENRPNLASLVSRWHENGTGDTHLLSLLRGHRIKKILTRMLDETEFLSDHGIRALSKYHKDHPYAIDIDGTDFTVEYAPGESTSGLFGGNSNWRGPVWMPANFLIIESLQRFHYYYGNGFKVECPTGSGNYLTLEEVAEEITKRLVRIFKKDPGGNRPVSGAYEKIQKDPHFSHYILFYEYFHGDTGRGVGASHQTGWTGLIAKLLQPHRKEIKIS